MKNEEKNTKGVYKPKPVSGFPEWLPEVRLVEQHWLDHIRKVFESYGFCSIETPSVEELDVLQAKGEVDKEIYVIERLHKEEGDNGKEARLALHFDQTVPLARYVAQHFNDLVFPFKRYQMQRVWRGERPQAGRFREFTQCDIDVIGIDSLPLHFDAELPAIMWEVMTGLPGMEKEKIQIRISNRKILSGILLNAGISSEGMTDVLRTIDGLEKKIIRAATSKKPEEIDFALAIELMAEEFKKHQEIFSIKDLENLIQTIIKSKLFVLTKPSVELQIELIDEIINKSSDASEGSRLSQKGAEELKFTLNQLSHLPEGSVVTDLSLVRGLDYYTGTVYETVFLENPYYGSICSGGRYDDLAGSYINKNLPGVGISIGFSRLFDYLRAKGAFDTTRKSPAHILMVLPSDERRALAADTARILRQRGFNVELYHAAKKVADQMKYASRKGIPFVWFPPFEDDKPHEVKNMFKQTQIQADPETWTPGGKS